MNGQTAETATEKPRITWWKAIIGAFMILSAGFVAYQRIAIQELPDILGTIVYILLWGGTGLRLVISSGRNERLPKWVIVLTIIYWLLVLLFIGYWHFFWKSYGR